MVVRRVNAKKLKVVAARSPTVSNLKMIRVRVSDDYYSIE